LRVAPYPPVSLGRDVLIDAYKTAINTDARLGELIIFAFVWPVLSTQAQLDAISASHGPYLLHLASTMRESYQLSPSTTCVGCGESRGTEPTTPGLLNLVRARDARRALLQATLFMGAVCKRIECLASCYRVETTLERKAAPSPHVLAPRRRRICCRCHVRETTGPKFKTCSRCKCDYYCSMACQATHWPEHRAICHAVAALREKDTD